MNSSYPRMIVKLLLAAAKSHRKSRHNGFNDAHADDASKFDPKLGSLMRTEAEAQRKLDEYVLSRTERNNEEDEV